MKQKDDNRTADFEDIFVWPDGTWCYRYEVNGMTHVSDDYIVIPFGEVQYKQFFEEKLKELNR
jgi:hypothetical protein